jgi:hypothetical protein
MLFLCWVPAWFIMAKSFHWRRGRRAPPCCDHVPSEMEIFWCVIVFIIFKRQPFVPDLNHAWSESKMQLLFKTEINPCTCPMEMPNIFIFCSPLALLFCSFSRWHQISKYYATRSLSCAAWHRCCTVPSISKAVNMHKLTILLFLV